jgi:hypothetical protein
MMTAENSGVDSTRSSPHDVAFNRRCSGQQLAVFISPFNVIVAD